MTTTAPPSTPTVDRPLEHADGLELVGEFKHSGYKNPPSIVRLATGQTVQLTELLYVVLSCIDGQRDHAAIAAAVSEQIGKTASADDVKYLAEEKLRPLGVLKEPDGSNPEVKKPDPLLSIKGRFTLANEQATQVLTSPFRVLFLPPIVLAALVAFFGMCYWLFFGEGLAGATRSLLYSPAMLVLTFALTAASAGFHEFGHAAACRYGGARPGVIGGGVYLVWPAFYTDVTDSYRLDRRGRLRTDLGGLYFNMLFALGTVGMWMLTHYDPLLVLVPLQIFQMTHQLMPFIRMDGYYILADLTGVPDLFARIKPTLVSLVPGRPTHERVEALKPWVRVVVTLWVLAVVPLILVSMTFAVIGLPRLLATVGDSLGRQWDGVTDAAHHHAYMRMVAGGLASFAVALPGASVVYMLSRMVARTSRALWKRTEGRPIARVALAPGAAALAVGLAFLWWPNGEYRPLKKGEKWTVQDAVSHVRQIPTGRPGLTAEREEQLKNQSTTTTAPSVTSTTVADDTTDSTTRRTTTTEERSTTTEQSRPTETTTP